MNTVIDGLIQRTLVERIVRIRLQEEVLQPHHDGVKIKNRFPIFSEDIEAYIAFEIDIRMVDLDVRSKTHNQHTVPTEEPDRHLTFGVHLTFGGSCG